MKRTRKIWGIVALVAVLGFIFSIARLLRSVAGPGSTMDFFATVRDPRGQFPAKNRVNILLLGKDYSYLWTKKNTALNGARYTKASRADSIMMLSLDMDNGKVSALSIPRDTRVTAPDGVTGKINGTYSRGGPKLIRETVTQMLGVAPDYFIAVKPDAVRDMVTALGGVSVETKDTMEYNDAAAGLHITLPKGPQVINGEQAVGFARFREADMYERQPNGLPIFTGEKDSQGNPIFRRRRVVMHSKEEGDPNRMARQQQLIRAMIARAKSPSDWVKLPQIIDTGFGEIETDLTRPQIVALVALFRGIQPDQMQTGTLQGKGTTHGTYFMVLDESKKRAMVDWLLKGDEAAANRLTVVAVENGTEVPGAAGRIAARLRQEGFDAKSAGTVPGATSGQEVPQTRVTYGKASLASRAQRIAQLLGVPTARVVKEVKAEPTPGSAPAPVVAAALPNADVTIVIGTDLAATYAPKSARL